MAPRRSLGHALGIPFRRSRGATIVPIPPNIITATVEDETPTKVYINFAWNLDDTSVPDPSAFTLAGKIISGVVITGATVTLTVTVAYVYGDVITVDYTMPGADPLKQESTGASILSWVGQVVTNYVHTPEVSTYIDGLVTPLSDGQLALLNNFILTLKAGLSITNLSDAFDVMYILAGETAESSLRNMVRRAHDATTVNAPAYIPFEGFTSNLTSSYINSNYNPFTQGLKFVQDSASWGIYSRTSRAGINTKTIIGNNGVYHRMLLFNTSNQVTGGVNSVGYDPVGNITSLGFYIYQRPNNTMCQLSKNGAAFNNALGGSSTPLNVNTFILCTNNGAGSPTGFDDCQCSIAFIARHFSNAEALVIFNAVEAYMDANGKGVIA